MNFKRVFIFLIVVVVLGGGVFLMLGRPAPESSAGGSETAVGAPETTTDATNTRVVNIDRDSVSAEGRIVPLRHAELAFQSGGRVAEVLVQEGDMVTADRPLIRLEATDLEASLSQAETALEKAQAALQVADARIKTAEVGVQIADVGVSAAEAQLALTASEPLTQEIDLLKSEIAAAQAAISQAAANRDVSLAGPTDAQIQSAQANVAAADVEKQAAQIQYDEIIKRGIGGAPEEQTRYALHAAQVALDAAQAALTELEAGPTVAEQRSANAAVSMTVAQRDIVQSRLDLLLAGPKPEQIQIAAVGVEQAKAAVAQAETAVEEAKAAKAQAQTTVTEAEVARDAAQAALDKMTLRAPFDGTVALLGIEQGTVISAGAPILTLADLSGWLVETTDLTEWDVVVVAVGLPATVGIDAIPGETLTGQVTDIAAISGLNRGDVTYEVVVTLDGTADLALRWGMTAYVTVDVGD